jgi:hypothetical protein
MKSILFTATAPVIASLVLIGGCGGGDDDLSGGLTEFSVQPAEISVTVPAGSTTCAVGYVGKVFIFGGTPPYRLKNSFDSRVALDKALVNNEGGDFIVTFLGGCMDPGTVIVEDSLGRTTSVSLINKIGE